MLCKYIMTELYAMNIIIYKLLHDLRIAGKTSYRAFIFIFIENISYVVGTLNVKVMFHVIILMQFLHNSCLLRGIEKLVII